MTKNIPIFIINLERDKARKAYISNELNRHQLSFDFIEGVDVSLLSEKQINTISEKYKAINSIGRELSQGEIGCAMSHFSIYQKMIDEKIERVIVLEDDAILTDHGFNEVIRFLARMTDRSGPEVYLFTPVTSYLNKKTRCINNTYSVANIVQALSTKGYMINYLAAKNMLHAYSKVWTVADDWVRHKRQAKVDIFCIIPSIVKKNSNFSSSVGSDRYKQVKKRTVKYVLSRNLNKIIADFKKYFWYMPFRGYTRNR